MSDALSVSDLRDLAARFDGNRRTPEFHELRHAGLAAAAAMKELIGEAQRSHPGQAFRADEQRRFDAHELSAQLVQAALAKPDEQELRFQQDADMRMANPAIFGGSEWQREDRERDFWRSWMSGEGPRQIEVPIGAIHRQREMAARGQDPSELRSLLWDTGSIASAVPTHMANSLYETMTAGISMMRLPTTKIVTSDGAAIKFPRLATHSVGTMVAGQGTALAGTDPGFNSFQLDAFKYGQLVQVSSETVTDSSFDVLGFLSGDLARALAEVVDVDLVTGNGTGKPNGIMNALTSCGSVTTGGSLVDPTYEKLIDVAYAINDNYRSSPSAAWLMRDLTAANLRKLRDGAGGTVGSPLWQTSTTMGIAGASQPPLLLGFPAYTDPSVASLASNARVIAFADWSAYYLRLVGGVVFERSDDFAFSSDLVTVRAKMRVDGELADTSAAVSLLRGV